MEGEAEKQKTKEEGLYCLLHDKEKKATELQQAYDAQCQHLRDVAVLVTVSNGVMFHACYVQVLCAAVLVCTCYML